MTGETKPFDPFWIKPLTSDDRVIRRLAKKLPKVEPRKPPEDKSAAAKKGDDGIVCPSCRCPMNTVLATRKTLLGMVWRRRECFHCGCRFSTSERVVKASAKETKNAPIDISDNRVGKNARKRR